MFAQGIRLTRGHQWGASSVRRILSSELYAGRAYFNRRERVANPTTGKPGSRHRMRPARDWIPVEVPTLLPTELFDRAQQQLSRNKAVLVGRPPVQFYLLRGLLRCAGCGRRYGGNLSQGRRFYRCADRDTMRSGARCQAPDLPAERIEGFIWTTVVNVLKRPALLTEKLEAHRIKLGARDIEVRSEAEHVARQLTEAERQEGKLLDLYLGDQLDTPAVRERLEALRRRRTSLTEQLAGVRDRIANQAAQEARQDAIQRFCAQALRGLRNLTPEGRQRLLRALVDEIVPRGDVVEIHGVLPGEWSAPGAGENWAESQDDRSHSYRLILNARSGS